MDRSLIQIYSAEQAEHIARIRELLETFTDSSSPALDELLRRAHTLKGAARAVGLDETETLLHLAEGALSRFRNGGVSQPDLQRALSGAMDAAEDVLAAASADRPLPDTSEITQRLQHLGGGSARSPVPSSNAAHDEAREPEPATVVASPALVRVNAETLDELIGASAQLLMTTTAAMNMEDIENHAAHIDNVSVEWEHVRRRAGSSKTSADGIMRSADHSIEECFSFVDRELSILRRQAHSVAASHRTRNERVHRQADEVYRNAFRVRTVAAEVVFGGFGPMVRDLARQEGKQVEFKVEGLEVQADRLVLQAFKDPVMHLLRNAVSHGIEQPRDRSAIGKPEAGSIRLRLFSLGGRLNIAVEDDGRGINRRAVADEARRRGMISPGQSVGTDEAADLILQPGFSTAKMITTLSGRGMGLSNVQQTVNRLSGELSIRPLRPYGTSVSISVPLSISTQHVLLVGAGPHTFAISTAFVERLIRVATSDLKTLNGRSTVATGFGVLPLTPLAGLLNIESIQDTSSQDDRMLQCVVLALGGEHEALVVDRLLDEREAGIKDTGLPPSMAGLTAGAIPLEDGGLAVMLNVTELFARISEWRSVERPPLREEEAPARACRIVVADDSLTTRSLEKSILEANGYEVEVAVDGMEALERIRANPPDLVISDVMMPRLTGFELLERLKGSAETKQIPVILVTSLESREEQQQGLSLGADAYIVKRKFDQKELLRVVRQIL